MRKLVLKGLGYVLDPKQEYVKLKGNFSTEVILDKKTISKSNQSALNIQEVCIITPNPQVAQCVFKAFSLVYPHKINFSKDHIITIKIKRI